MSHRVLGAQFPIPLVVDARGPKSLSGVFRNDPEPRVEEVDVSRLRATQSAISESHVQSIAKTPKSAMDKRKKMPRGYEHDDGSVWLDDGHHRAAAALVRGDGTVRMKIAGHVNPKEMWAPKGWSFEDYTT